MTRAIVNPAVCKGCLPCSVETDCPKKAVIRETTEDLPWIDFYKCSGCLKCKMYCPNNAIDEVTHPCDGKARKGW